MKKRTAAIIAILLISAFFLVASPGTIIGINQSAVAVLVGSGEDSIRGAEGARIAAAAPSVVTGDNVYIAWWNGTAGLPDVQTDVMFRASNDGGATFSDKMNLSNTPTADSVDAEIAAEGANVIVTWWERNQTSNAPVARMSTDGGETFGPMLRLGMNGTLTSTTEGGGETTEEEAVGGAEVAE